MGGFTEEARRAAGVRGAEGTSFLRPTRLASHPCLCVPGPSQGARTLDLRACARTHTCASSASGFLGSPRRKWRGEPRENPPRVADSLAPTALRDGDVRSGQRQRCQQLWGGRPALTRTHVRGAGGLRLCGCDWSSQSGRDRPLAACHTRRPVAAGRRERHLQCRGGEGTLPLPAGKRDSDTQAKPRQADLSDRQGAPFTVQD